MVVSPPRSDSEREESVEITAMGGGGDGLGRLADGQVVFVRGALPDEQVRVEVACGRDFARGRMIAIERGAPDRVAPPCPAVAEGCGGCDWQHLRPEAQVRHKRLMVVDALRRIGKVVDAEFLVSADPPLPSVGYRTTVRVRTTADGRAGFRAHSSHRVVPIPPSGCLIAHPTLGASLQERLPPNAEFQFRSSIATGRVVRSEAETGPDRTRAERTRATNTRRGGPSVSEPLMEVVAGASFQVSPASFFQTRPDGAERLVQVVGDALTESLPDRRAGAQAANRLRTTLVDLYGGVGLFSATIGRRADRVVLVERSSSAVGDARRNLARLRQTGTEVDIIEADVDHWRPSPAFSGHVITIADPARGGLGRAGVATIVACRGAKLVLISCDGASLGRDAALLIAHGYRLSGSTVVDLFPHTPHVEVVSVFDPVGSLPT